MLQPESRSSCSPLPPPAPLCLAGVPGCVCAERGTLLLLLPRQWAKASVTHGRRRITAAPVSSTGKQMHDRWINLHWQGSASGSAEAATGNVKGTSIFNILLSEGGKKYWMYLCLSFHLCSCVKDAYSTCCLSNFKCLHQNCLAKCSKLWFINDLKMVQKLQCHPCQSKGECNW